MSEKNKPAKRAKPCPICKKMSVDSYFPFCSKRCADVDLGNWLKGGYAIPTNERPPISGSDDGSEES